MVVRERYEAENGLEYSESSNGEAIQTDSSIILPQLLPLLDRLDISSSSK